jgi:hypothetical protein
MFDIKNDIIARYRVIETYLKSEKISLAPISGLFTCNARKINNRISLPYILLIILCLKRNLEMNATMANTAKISVGAGSKITAHDEHMMNGMEASGCCHI